MIWSADQINNFYMMKNVYCKCAEKIKIFSKWRKAPHPTWIYWFKVSADTRTNVWDLLRDENTNNRTTSLMLLWCVFLLTLNKFHTVLVFPLLTLKKQMSPGMLPLWASTCSKSITKKLPCLDVVTLVSLLLTLNKFLQTWYLTKIIASWNMAADFKKFWVFYYFSVGFSLMIITQ